ncbi:4-carboxymuconolactone decarboxylase, partial [Parabacteroides merdae]
MENKVFNQLFPQGEKLPEQFSEYFIGQAYLARLTANKDLNVPISNVTFEPGCRNNWHSHTGGQLLVATAGRGYYQEQGKPAVGSCAMPVYHIRGDFDHISGF